jgi:hypothetical protein
VAGPPNIVAQCDESHTGRFLRLFLDQWPAKPHKTTA